MAPTADTPVSPTGTGTIAAPPMVTPLDMTVSSPKNPDEFVERLLTRTAHAKKKVSLDDLAACPTSPTGGRPLVVTSPRSLEACLIHGIDPEELVYRPLESFAERGLSLQLQELKFQHHEEKRKEKLHKVQKEREQLMAEEMAGHTVSHTDRSPGSPGPTSPSGIDKSDMVEKEKKRLEALQRRQQKEIENMINYETRRQQLSHEAQMKIERQKEKEQQQIAELARREREWQEQMRLRDLQRLQEEEELERRAKQMAAEQYMQELARQKAEIERQKQRQREAAARQAERAAKQEALRQANERAQAEQQEALRRRQEEIATRDEERQHALEEQRRQRNLANQEAREKAEERIKGALENSRRIMEKRMEEYEQKQRAADQKQQEMEQERRELEMQKRQQEAMKAEQRRAVYFEAQREEQRRKEMLIAKAAEAERVLQQVKVATAREIQQRSVARRLDRQDKQDKVESMKRMQAYQRRLMLEKIESETERARALLEARAALQEQRKLANVMSSIHRQRLIERMEQTQVTKKWRQLDADLRQLNADAFNPLTQKTKSTTNEAANRH